MYSYVNVALFFRVIIDRGFTPWDDSLDRLDLTDAEAHGDYVTYIREKKM